MIRPEAVFIDQDGSRSTVHVRCKGGCGEVKQVVVSTLAYDAWQGGVLIQRAMPGLSVDQRELLISGTCGECWERIFPAEEEEE